MGNFNITSKAFYGLAILASSILSSCSIRPVSWKSPIKPTFEGVTAINEKLTNSEIIQINGMFGPEDIIFDTLGNLYCGVHTEEAKFNDGRILKIDTKGKVEVFYEAHSWVAGLHFDQTGNLIALSHREGLISIDSSGKATVLASKDDKGRPFLIPNGLDIAADGKIYFSNTSEQSAYTIKYGRRVILEMMPIGGLYCYDPATKGVKTLIDGTYFGNGVVLSKDEDFLLMTETSKYRVIKFWLKGEKQGTTEVLMENLPGFPNGISIRDNGTFWLGYSTKRNDALDKIHSKPGMKKVVYSLPAFLQPKPEKFGMVMNITSEGKIIETLFDPFGERVPEAGAVKESNGYLYIGGDVIPYIAKYKIAQ